MGISTGIWVGGETNRFRPCRRTLETDVQIIFRGSAVKNGRLEVRIDPQGTGTYQDCFTVDNVLPGTFDHKKSYFGISATTGQLADNHDVLSLDTYQLESYKDPAPEPLDATSFKEFQEEPLDLKALNKMDTAEIMETMMGRVEAKVDFKLGKLQADIEFKMSSIMDHIRVAVDKLADAEQGDRASIEELQKEVYGYVQVWITVLCILFDFNFIFYCKLFALHF